MTPAHPRTDLGASREHDNPADTLRNFLTAVSDHYPISMPGLFAALDLLQSHSDTYRKDVMPGDPGADMDVAPDEMHPERG